MSGKKIKKVANIVLNILLYAFLAVCIVLVILTVFAKRNADGAAEMFGYQMRVVTSNSMAKCELTDVSDYEIGSIPVRSMVFVKTVPGDEVAADKWYRSLKVGDVLTFRYVYTTQVTITHRITDIKEKDTGGFIIELAGDNKNSDSTQLYQSIDTSVANNTNYIIGKVVGQSYVLGFVMSLVMTPIGIALIIIIPCLVIILLEVIKIVKMVGLDKRKHDQEQTEKRQNELEMLRQRVAELEKEKEENTVCRSNVQKEDNK